MVGIITLSIHIIKLLGIINRLEYSLLVVLIVSDDNLLIGTREGHLLMYNVPSVFDDSHKLELLRHSKNFNKKRINQIDVVPEYNLLIILTGILKIIFVLMN